MTCSKLALVTLLTGLLSLVSVTVVSAFEPCDGQADNRCPITSIANDTTLFSASIAPIPAHMLSGDGMGQEHFEAMMTTRFSVFSVAAPRAVAPHLPGYAQEHFEELMSH